MEPCDIDIDLFFGTSYNVKHIINVLHIVSYILIKNLYTLSQLV